MPEPMATFPPALSALGASLDRAMRAAEHAQSEHRRSVWRRPLPMATAALVLAASVLAIVLPGEDAATRASAAEVLARAAKVALAEPALIPRADQYYYVRERDINRDAQLVHGVFAHEVITFTRSIWTSPTRRGRLLQVVTAIHYPTARDRRLLAGKRSGRSISTSLPPQNNYFTRPRVLRLLLSPATYRLHPGSATEAFSFIGDALRESPAPPSVRSELYRALAVIPGVRLVGAVRTAVGRTGTGVAIVRDGVREELIFDTATAEIIGERYVVVSAGAGTIGTVIEDDAYLRRAITDTTQPPG